MAKSKTLISILFITLTLLFSTLATADDSGDYYKDIPPTSVGVLKERLAHLHFYLHEGRGGPKPSAVSVAEAPTTKNSSTNFGLFVIADDPLTVGPEPNSKEVGKAQGFYGYASQEELGITVAFTLAFTEGKYNGSTLNLLGRQLVLAPLRELAIVGGSEAFRFARGYAQVKTYSVDKNTGDPVAEYNVYVFHYV